MQVKAQAKFLRGSTRNCLLYTSPSPRDHPHGGGEGKSPTGMPPKTPWGKPAMGYRTRRAKLTGRLIVRSRHRK